MPESRSECATDPQLCWQWRPCCPEESAKDQGKVPAHSDSIQTALFKVKTLNFQFRFYLFIKKKTKLESHLPVLASHHPSVLHTPYYIQALDKQLVFPKCWQAGRHLTLHTSLTPGMAHTAYPWPQTVSHITHLGYTGMLQPCWDASLLFKVRFMIPSSHHRKHTLILQICTQIRCKKKGARNQPS